MSNLLEGVSVAHGLGQTRICFVRVRARGGEGPCSTFSSVARSTFQAATSLFSGAESPGACDCGSTCEALIAEKGPTRSL